MRREEQILDAAEKLFAERSYDSVGVDAIGEEAGITGSAIYRHFSSKDEILASLIDRATDALLVRTTSPLDDPWEELNRLIVVHVDFSVKHRQLAGIWQREQRSLSLDRQRALWRRQKPYIDHWLESLDACYPGLTVEERLSTIRALHALITSDATRPSSGRAADHLAELLVEMSLGSLTALAERSRRASSVRSVS